MRRDQEYVGRKMMKIELPGKRRRGRPKRRFLDVVKEDMKEVGVKEMDIEDRKMWRIMIHCGHPLLMGKAERRRRRRSRNFTQKYTKHYLLKSVILVEIVNSMQMVLHFY